MIDHANMIKITSRESGEQITLEQCAKEHGMETIMGHRPHLALDGDNPYFFFISFGNYVYDTFRFDSSRFKLEITNETA